MYVPEGVGSGFCFEYACVREKVCRYSSVSEENEGEGTKSSLMRAERGPLVRERGKTKEIETFTMYISIKLFRISSVSTHSY